MKWWYFINRIIECQVRVLEGGESRVSLGEIEEALAVLKSLLESL